eukprot:6926289-Prymnesium_polylepis.1
MGAHVIENGKLLAQPPPAKAPPPFEYGRGRGPRRRAGTGRQHVPPAPRAPLGPTITETLVTHRTSARTIRHPQRARLKLTCSPHTIETLSGAAVGVRLHDGHAVAVAYLGAIRDERRRVFGRGGLVAQRDRVAVGARHGGLSLIHI